MTSSFHSHHNTIINNVETFRSNIAKQLATIIKGDEKSGRNLERSVYNWTIREATARKIIKKWGNSQFYHLYYMHLRSVYINLKNTNLIDLIVAGDIDVENVANMTHQEMDPNRWSEYIKAKSIKDKIKFEQNIEAMTDIFTCRKCKSNKCSFYQLQTRSADEPMTIFVTCLNCGKRWKTS